MRPITPASRCRTAVNFPSMRQAKPPRHVTAFAHVDASMSKPQLMKLKKAELIEACKDKGVATVGKKDQLASNLLAFFATEGETAVVATSAAASSTDLLSQRVSELDSAIQMRTEELQSLHDGDRAAMEKLLAEVAGVKGTWQNKLTEISAVLEDVVTLKKGQLEVGKLNKQQEELQEELKVLSRMLKLREDEIKSLETQLQEVRKERATEKESVEADRLANVAVLALASQVAGGPPDSSVQSLRSMYAAPSYIPAVPAGSGTGAPGSFDSHPIDVMPRSFPIQDMGPRSYPIRLPTYAPAPKEDVLGAALPGLLFCGVVQKVHNVYSGVRNSFVESETNRKTADTCAAAAVLATMLMTHIV